MTDPYQILEVERTADDAAIKTSYRRLAKIWHPDKNPGNPEAEVKFQAISNAYDQIKDATKRREYDAQTSPRPNMHSPAWGWSRRPQGPQFEMDIEEVLRDIRNTRNPFPNDARNRDVVLSYSITLEEAFLGKEADLKYSISGQTQEVKFKIPIGIADGMKLRFQGRGDNVMTHVSPGDLFIKINIIPHIHFVRMGYHLVTSATIGYLDALLGTECDIPTIEGKKIRMRVPAGIQPGQSLRAVGKGMPTHDGKRGDMMVEIVFESEKLSDEERHIITDLRAKRNA